MSPFDHSTIQQTIEQYQKVLNADPHSKIFAVLAEAYLELGILEQAENILRRGIQRHPEYAAGYLVLAKVFLQSSLQKNSFPAALQLLEKTIELAPDNVLAFQLLGETHLRLKNPQAALQAHKMALFLNPLNSRSKQVVQALEKLSAEDYADDLFEMKPLQAAEAPDTAASNSPPALPAQAINQSPSTLERGLAFVDALIVRQQEPQARQHLLTLQEKFPGDPEIIQRLQMLQADDDIEQAQDIQPVASREKMIIAKKIERLQKIRHVLNQRSQNS